MPAERMIDLRPDHPLPIAAAAAATGVSARRINRLIDDDILPRSAFIKVSGRRAVLAHALPMVSFGDTDGAKLSKKPRVEAMSLMARFAKSNWTCLRERPDDAPPLRYESGLVTVVLTDCIRRAMSGLDRLAKAEARVVRDPEIRGGAPVIRGTRIGVYEAADAVAADGVEAALEDFPSLRRADLEAAMIFAEAHPRTGRPRRSASTKRRLKSEAAAPAGRRG